VAAINHALRSRVAIYYSAVRHRRSAPWQSDAYCIDAARLSVFGSHTLQIAIRGYSHY